MSLNLHLLRLFATVARVGSFSQAAGLLGISQPAVSKSVRDFEAQVGCRLLDRGPKGVRPTREGEALARHAVALFAAQPGRFPLVHVKDLSDPRGTQAMAPVGQGTIDFARIINAFPDLDPGTADCPRGCTHDEPECALDVWVETGHAGPAGSSRLDSLRRVLRARSGAPE